MYIRWVTRRHKSPLSTETVFHDAYLVESYRDDRGRPRQRTLSYLGNLRETDGRVPHVESELFLLRAKRRLHELSQGAPVDTAAVLDGLRRQLPALTPEEARHAFTQQVSWFYEWWAHHGDSSPEDEILQLVEAIIGGRERAV